VLLNDLSGLEVILDRSVMRVKPDPERPFLRGLILLQYWSLFRSFGLVYSALHTGSRTNAGPGGFSGRIGAACLQVLKSSC